MEGTQNAIGFDQKPYVFFFKFLDVLKFGVGKAVHIITFEVGIHKFYDAEVTQIS